MMLYRLMDHFPKCYPEVSLLVFKKIYMFAL